MIIKNWMVSQMNKLNITKYILFILVTLFTIISWICGLADIITIDVVAYTILTLSLFIILLRDYIKKDSANEDSKYNILSILSFVFMLIVFLRTFFDQQIVVVGLGKALGSTSNKMIFLGNNLMYFSILLLSIIFYRLTFLLKEEDKKTK